MATLLDTDTGPKLFPAWIKVRKPADVPAANPRIVDVALLDMNHCWPNIGHDSLAGIVQEAAGELRDFLTKADLQVRILSFDVRQSLMLPVMEGNRFQLFLGTGGPGHLDPRINDGLKEESQGINESPAWEKPLFALFDSIAENPRSSLIAVCHTFGLLCRWSGVADPVLRAPAKGGKSTGVPTNVLTDAAVSHPWFSGFSRELPDRRHFRIVDNRLFDLIPRSATLPTGVIAISFESDDGPDSAITMIEFARDRAGIMPRFFAVNHHPEIIDRNNLLNVLNQKLKRKEVTTEWYDERANTLAAIFVGEVEQQSRMTSRYTLIDPIRFHLTRIVRERAELLGIVRGPREEQTIPVSPVASTSSS